MKLRTKLVAPAFALALLLPGLWIYAQAVRSVRVTMSLVGFTTNAMTFTTSEGTFSVTSATFCVSNVGRSKVVLNGICCFEAMLDTNSCESGIYYDAFQSAGIVAPGESKKFSITTPWTIHGPRRIGLPVSRYGWRHRLYALDPWKQILVRRFVSEEWLMRIPSETLRSGWVGRPKEIRVPSDEPNEAILHRR